MSIIHTPAAPRQTLTALVQLAVLARSGLNAQPWRLWIAFSSARAGGLVACIRLHQREMERLTSFERMALPATVFDTRQAHMIKPRGAAGAARARPPSGDAQRAAAAVAAHWLRPVAAPLAAATVAAVVD